MARQHVVSVRLDDRSLMSVDLLVRAGLAQSRSEAAAQLIEIGAHAAAQLLSRVEGLVGDIDAVRSQFFDAVRGHDAATAGRLVRERPLLAETLSDEGQTPMLAAVYSGAGEVFDVLRSEGLDPSIFEAAAYGDERRVRDLLATDPDLVQAHSTDGWTALHLASHFGHLGIVRILVEAGADIAARSENDMQNTPINAAVFSNRLAVVRWLLDQGADIDARQRGGLTPLHRAAMLGHLELVRLLLERGADRSLRTADGRTAGDLATARSHDDIARLLQE